MKIGLIVEGKTEKAFLPALMGYFERSLSGRMPKLDCVPFDGRIPKGDKLRRVVERLLNGANPVEAVIALTDVYTGTNPPDFSDASDAKRKMRKWVGEEPRFHPHAAQYEFETWLLPYWDRLQGLAGHNASAPSGNPETVNHNNPPSKRIEDLFLRGSKGRAYKKTSHTSRILREVDLSVAVSQCSELKALVNTILSLCGGEKIP